jgi:hypothetical protein
VRFLVHRELLTHHSPFFAAALTGTFAEGLSQTISLPAEPLATFELFVAWLYTQSLSAHRAAFFKDAKPAYYTLLHLYALADRLAIEALRNAVVDTVAELAESTNSVPTPSDTALLYEGVRDSAPLRALVLDLFGFKRTDRLLAEHCDPWHPLFLRDLVVRLKRPGEAAMRRHCLRPWTPAAWAVTRACAVCGRVVRPGVEVSACVGCARAFCGSCGAAGRDVVRFEAGVDVCKPWKGSRCVLYHEHKETESCGDVAMGK